MFDFRCEDCGAGMVRKHNIQNFATKIRGYPYTVPLAVVGVCDNCGAHVFDPTEVRQWDSLFTAELERKGQILSAGEIRELREELGLSIADFAKLVGATRQSVYNWERKDRKSPPIRPVDLLLRLIRESMASGRIDVLAILQRQARAVNVVIKVKTTGNVTIDGTRCGIELASSNKFDHLFQAGKAPVPLPTLYQ